MTEASQFLRTRAERSWRILALGPPTNIAQAYRAGMGTVAEVVLVGGNLQSWGRWPPYWPFEYNFTHDWEATRELVDSTLPLTLVPLNVCGRLKVGAGQVAALRGELGQWLAAESGRWWRRALWRKGRRRVPIWDLVAAFYALEPEWFRLETARVVWHPRRGIVRARHGRPVRVVRDYSPARLWARFETLVSGAG